MEYLHLQLQSYCCGSAYTDRQIKCAVRKNKKCITDQLKSDFSSDCCKGTKFMRIDQSEKNIHPKSSLFK